MRGKRFLCHILQETVVFEVEVEEGGGMAAPGGR